VVTLSPEHAEPFIGDALIQGERIGLVDLIAPGKVASEMAATGFPITLATPLGIVILLCAVIYSVPVTSVVGAILCTGFVGGAICTHFRLGGIGSPPQIISTLIAVAAWGGGLYLRCAPIRDVMPLIRPSRS
jgi:hypothetical protein